MGMQVLIALPLSDVPCRARGQGQEPLLPFPSLGPTPRGGAAAGGSCRRGAGIGGEQGREGAGALEDTRTDERGQRDMRLPRLRNMAICRSF